jgi:ABC-2 type transport system permease protein
MFPVSARSARSTDASVPARLSPYTAVAVRAYRRFSTYRGATFAGVATNTVFGFIYAGVFAAAHERVGDIDGVAVEQTVLFIFTAQAFLAMTGAFGDREISERIRTGDVAADLYRPVDFQLWWLSHDLGKAAFHAIFRGVPPFVIGVWALSLPVPSDLVVWAVFALATVLGVALAFGVRFLANLSAFWLLEARGVVNLTAITQSFLAGHFVPLYFMPDRLESLVRLLPFAGITAHPIEILVGIRTGTDIGWVFAHQLIWILALGLAGRWALSAAYRKLVVQGG